MKRIILAFIALNVMGGMARVSASEFVDKWSRRTKGATDDYRRGVQRVTEAPGAKAARRADEYVAGVQRAVAENKWQRNVAAVSLGEWQQQAAGKGASRIAAGVDGAESKVAAFAGPLLDHVDAGRQKLESMPRGGLDQNINRMVEFTRHMSTFRKPTR